MTDFFRIICADSAKILLDYGLIPTEKDIFYLAMTPMRNENKNPILKLVVPVFLNNCADSYRILKLYDIDADSKLIIKPDLELLYEKILDEYTGKKEWFAYRNNSPEEIWEEFNCYLSLNTYASDIKPSLRQMTVHEIIKNSEKYSRIALDKIPTDLLEMILDAMPILDNIDKFQDRYSNMEIDINQIRTICFGEEYSSKYKERQILATNIREILDERSKN